MTRKRIGQGLLEVFAEPCEACQGRGYHVHSEPIVAKPAAPEAEAGGGRRKRRGEAEPEAPRRRGAKAPAGPAVEVEPRAIDPTVSAAMEKIHAAAAKRAADAAAGIDVDGAQDAADDAVDAGDAREAPETAPEAPAEQPSKPEAAPSAATAAVRPVKRTRRKATRKAGPAAVDDV
jgi:ribonuclease E